MEITENIKGTAEHSKDNSEYSKETSENSNTDFSEPSTSKCGASKPKKAKLNRTRSSNAVKTSNSVSPLDWTEDEKMKLAIALQKYGHMDITNLHKEIPTKSCDQIKSFTYWIIKKSRLWFCHEASSGSIPVPKKGRRLFSKAPIDQWLSALEECQLNPRDEFRECLAKTFLYISRYEPHADPEDCDGVDYAAMYEFLYLALNGYPVKAVTPETATAILKSLEELSQKMNNIGHEREVEYLSKVKRLVFVENATKRHYGRKSKDNKPPGPIESLMNVKGFNPLNIPYDLLKRRHVSISQEAHIKK